MRSSHQGRKSVRRDCMLSPTGRTVEVNYYPQNHCCLRTHAGRDLSPFFVGRAFDPTFIMVAMNPPLLRFADGATRVVYTEWIFFGLLAAGLFLLRRRAAYDPPYRVWGYPVLPAIFVLSTAAIVINQVIAQPVESLTGLAFVLLGLPVYYIWARNPPTKTT